VNLEVNTLVFTGKFYAMYAICTVRLADSFIKKEEIMKKNSGDPRRDYLKISRSHSFIKRQPKIIRCAYLFLFHFFGAICALQ
jgi:hypothetical protein